MGQWRFVLKEKNDNDSEPIILVRSRSQSWELIGEADLDVSSESEGDVGPTEDNSPIYGMP